MRAATNLALRNLSISTSAYSGQQLQITALETGLASQASNGNFLAAMTAASGAFSVGRALGTSLFSNVLGGAGLRGAAFALGFTSEVLTFRGVNQILTPGSESWLSASGIASTATDFLMMKGAGAFCGTSSYGVRQFVQATAMVGGEYAGESIGVREHSGQAFSERFAHALATGVAMEAGGLLMRRATAGRIEALQRGLDSNLHHSEHAFSRSAGEYEQLGILGTMSSARSERASEIDGMIRDAAVDSQAAVRLTSDAHRLSADVEASHISLLLESIARQPSFETVLFMWTNRPQLFKDSHFNAMIHYMPGRPLVQKAVEALIKARPKLCSSIQLFEFVRRNQEALEARFVEVRQDTAADVFVKTHREKIEQQSIGSWIEIAREGEFSARILCALVKKNPRIIDTAHLPAMIEAAKAQVFAGQALFYAAQSLKARGEASVPLFMEIVRAGAGYEAMNETVDQLIREKFVSLNAAQVFNLINVSLNNLTAANALDTSVRLDKDWVTPAHVPALLNVAASQPGVVPVLNRLAAGRRLVEYFPKQHLPAIIALAGDHGSAGDLLWRVIENTNPTHVQPAQIPSIVEAAKLSDAAASALEAIIQRAPRFADALNLDVLLEIAPRRAAVGSVVMYLAREQASRFHSDHLPHVAAIARQNKDAIAGLDALLRARPELLTPAVLLDYVEVVSEWSARMNPPAQGKHQQRLLRFCSEHQGHFTADYVKPVLEQVPSRPEVGSILSQFVGSHPDYFTRAHLSAMLEIARSHVGSMMYALRQLLEKRPDLFIQDDLPGLIEIIGNPRTDIGVKEVDGAGILARLINWRSADFREEHLAPLIAVARENRYVAQSLADLVKARPELFTMDSLRTLLEITASWIGTR